MVIGGSTASGKSALSLELARRIGGMVINADSQQLFEDLPTLTARPVATETAQVPHRLYGLLAATEQPSVGRWLQLAAEALAEARRLDRTAIVTGGSGLYLHALLHGLPAMPEIPADLRAELRAFARTAADPLDLFDMHAQSRDEARAARAGMDWTGVVPYRADDRRSVRPDGRERRYDLIGRPTLGSRGEPLVFNTVIDITDLKRAQERLQQQLQGNGRPRPTEG